MTKIMIHAHDGGEFKAYMASPDGDSPAPVLIMIQEIFGINQEMREKCDHYAKLGYITICPDLFWRIEPGIELTDAKEEELERAFELFSIFDTDKGVQDLKSTLDHARNIKDGNGKVGCIGYCLGGKLAYLMATDTDIDAAVSYYGVGIADMLDKADAAKNPVLYHIAEEDEFVDADAQKQIKDALKEKGNFTLHTYEGADHAFARGDGKHYNPQAAKLANRRTEEFLKAHLAD